MQDLCGWVNSPGRVRQVLRDLPHPYFEDVASSLRGTPRRDVCFWDAEQIVLGRILPAHNQTIGDCVSHGWSRACQDVALLEMAMLGEPSLWLGEVASEPIYAGSRVEVGGGGISGDGSIGAWAAKWVNTMGGILHRVKYGEFDLTTYDGNRARSWGGRREGVPDALAEIARKHKMLNVSLVTSLDAGIDALCNWHPIPICSNVGFTMTRDSYGFCYRQGNWAHCMLARGYMVVKGNKPGVAIQQSWGNSPTGNQRVTLETGREIILPEGVFLIPLETFGQILAQDDSFVVYNDDAPLRPVNWESALDTWN